MVLLLKFITTTFYLHTLLVEKFILRSKTKQNTFDHYLLYILKRLFHFFYPYQEKTGGPNWTNLIILNLQI